jgi:hypothetical protein
MSEKHGKLIINYLITLKSIRSGLFQFYFYSHEKKKKKANEKKSSICLARLHPPFLTLPLICPPLPSENENESYG